ncbi:MAG: CPBP family intramembrane metalloprotease [Muribaculaceae bacterium]|nr:CPBP family intramembrane metalloprotease [Muribaculaceae bacterium]
MKPSHLLCAVLAAIAPTAYAYDIQDVCAALDSASPYHASAVYEVLLPQYEDPVRYNVELNSVVTPGDTLSRCDYLIDWSMRAPGGESRGFNAYTGGHHYRFRDKRMQEYHADADPTPFAPQGRLEAGVQRQAQFVQLLPQYVAARLREIAADSCSSYTVRQGRDGRTVVVEGSQSYQGVEALGFRYEFSLADGLSEAIGTEKLLTAPLALFMGGFLIAWAVRNAHAKKYGLTRPTLTLRQSLCYLPLVLLSTASLWSGVSMQLSAVETALYILSMIGVGITEEIIFRGLLFRALARDNLKTAVIVSSVTFGVGHIVNLLSGAPLLSTLLQIVYASAAGLLFTVILLKSGSLLPCILSHCVINSLSAFSVTASPAHELIVAAAMTALSVLYAVWILRQPPKASPENP